jgi:hypothetical protein
MLGDCTICTATSGNGVKTLGITIMLTNQITLKTTAMLYGWTVINLAVYGAVVLGTTIRGTVARRIGSVTMRMAGSTATVFAWLFSFPRLLIVRTDGRDFIRGMLRSPDLFQ